MACYVFAVLKTFAFGPEHNPDKKEEKNTITIAANTLSVKSRKEISIEAREEKRGFSCAPRVHRG